MLSEEHMNFTFVKIRVGELHFASKPTDRSALTTKSNTWFQGQEDFAKKKTPLSTVPIICI